jgi:hypothetical protein
MVQAGAARFNLALHLCAAAGSRQSTLTGGVGLVLRLSAPLVITSPIEYAYPSCGRLLSTLLCRSLDCVVAKQSSGHPDFRSCEYTHTHTHTQPTEQWGGEC